MPDLGRGALDARVEVFRQHYDRWRLAILGEPKGWDGMVGALLCEPHDITCDAGVIFFNNVGYLGMCGHGAIGVVASLAEMRRVVPGSIRLETPVGIVTTQLLESGDVVLENVPSYRERKDVCVTVPGYGPVRGDVAWGGNWFFLIEEHGLELRLSNLDNLTRYASHVRRTLADNGITGRHGANIDHIELFAPTDATKADARNFVLCPGDAYDRSPCGTGTSAKLACLYEDGKLAAGQQWRQESIIGSVFRGSVAIRDGRIHPSILGRAHVTLQGSLVIDEDDPFAWGIGADR